MFDRRGFSGCASGSYIPQEEFDDQMKSAMVGLAALGDCAFYTGGFVDAQVIGGGRHSPT